MKKYTYRTMELPVHNIDSAAEEDLRVTLVEAGNAGFELVSIITFTKPSGAIFQRLYFKKEEEN